MPRWIFGCCLCWSILSIAVGVARGDGGTLRVSEMSGDFRITVFTSPAPLRAGPIDVSVLVQDAATGETLANEDIEVRVWPKDRPDDMISHEASSAVATNKLFHDAQFKLPQPGEWHIEVTVKGSQGTGEVHFLAQAANPLPRWVTLWPWFTWPFVVILLFVAGKLVS